MQQNSAHLTVDWSESGESAPAPRCFGICETGSGTVSPTVNNGGPKVGRNDPGPCGRRQKVQEMPRLVKA